MNARRVSGPARPHQPPLCRVNLVHVQVYRRYLPILSCGGGYTSEYPHKGQPVFTNRTATELGATLPRKNQRQPYQERHSQYAMTAQGIRDSCPRRTLNSKTLRGWRSPSCDGMELLFGHKSTHERGGRYQVTDQRPLFSSRRSLYTPQFGL